MHGRLCMFEREGPVIEFSGIFLPPQDHREETKSKSEEKEEYMIVGGSSGISGDISCLRNLGHEVNDNNMPTPENIPTPPDG